MGRDLQPAMPTMASRSRTEGNSRRVSLLQAPAARAFGDWRQRQFIAGAHWSDGLSPRTVANVERHGDGGPQAGGSWRDRAVRGSDKGSHARQLQVELPRSLAGVDLI